MQHDVNNKNTAPESHPLKEAVELPNESLTELTLEKK
jgi:hypothetical protein